MTYYSKPVDNSEFISGCKAKIDNVLNPLIPRGSKCALVDFPNYPNVGDSAIWLGEVYYLRQRRIKLRYICDHLNYNKDLLYKSIGNGIILIQGGGNFGDLWEHHQRLRETIILDFPHNPIIQLPQSIHFEKEESLQRAREIYKRHSKLTLILRDKKSYEFAQKEFNNAILLCPDMAFYLNIKKQGSIRSNRKKIIYLSRTDKECIAQKEDLTHYLNSIEQIDWLKEKTPKMLFIYKWINKKLNHTTKIPLQILQAIQICTANSVAKERLVRGISILRSGNAVITDRLHGHILTLLLDLPNFILDNSYGKISKFYSTWSYRSDKARLCHSELEAINLALQFLEDSRQR